MCQKCIERASLKYLPLDVTYSLLIMKYNSIKETIQKKNEAPKTNPNDSIVGKLARMNVYA